VINSQSSIITYQQLSLRVEERFPRDNQQSEHMQPQQASLDNLPPSSIAAAHTK